MDHDRIRGRDLHEPSTDRVVNNLSTFIAVGSLVPVDELRSGDNRPVNRLATEGEIPIGYVLRAIETGGSESVLTLGRVEPFDTSGMPRGTKLKSNSTGTGLIETDGAGAVAEVILGETTNGSILFNGLNGLVTIDADYLETFVNTDWTIDPLDGTMSTITFLHNLNSINASFDIYDANNQPIFITPFEQTALRLTFKVLNTEIFSGRILVSI